MIGARCGSLVQAMAGDLAAQVQAAVAGAAGAGPLEVAAAVARVFRAWRGEEAERWVRTVAYAAYHDSLLAGLAVSGVAEVVAVASGLLCPECPAGRGAAWDPAGNPPPGTARPPAHPGLRLHAGAGVGSAPPGSGEMPEGQRGAQQARLPRTVPSSQSPPVPTGGEPRRAEGVAQQAGLPRTASLPSVPSRPHGRGSPEGQRGSATSRPAANRFPQSPPSPGRGPAG